MSADGNAAEGLSPEVAEALRRAKVTLIAGQDGVTAEGAALALVARLETERSEHALEVGQLRADLARLEQRVDGLQRERRELEAERREIEAELDNARATLRAAQRAAKRPPGRPALYNWQAAVAIVDRIDEPKARAAAIDALTALTGNQRDSVTRQLRSGRKA